MMSSHIVRRSTCRLCGSSHLDLVFQLAPTPIGDAYVTADRLAEPQESYPIDLFLCRECGLSQLLDVISPDVLYGDYIYVTGSSLGLADHFRGYAEQILRDIKPPAGALVVDIGSNDGTLLKCFQERGMRVLGVDPARDIALETTARGIPTLPAFFDGRVAKEIHQTHGPAAIVTANNVFANVDDLPALTEAIRDLLAPDGVFVFESFYLADLLQNMVFDFIYHEHLSAFAVMPIASFCRRLGMELIDVTRVPTKGGSLRYTVQRAGGPQAVAPIVSQMIADEQRLGLYDPKTYQTFTAKIDALKQQTRRVLQHAAADGKQIAGFGASITGTTLIYHFGLGEFLTYLVDDNPAKQGRFSPGLHLPVFGSEVLSLRKPDYVVILAWRFVEPIVAKCQTFLEAGGRFVVPVPDVRVLEMAMPGGVAVS